MKTNYESTELFVTMVELRKMKFADSEWVVDGLLRTGRRRPSLLVAKPETGKSTLARQLAVAVSQGKPFLGRPTTRGAVIYWQTEDEAKDVFDSFNRLGSRDEDENIHVFQGDSGSSGCEDIATLLSKVSNVRLVIIETLDDLLKMTDIKENTAARAAFEDFNTQLMSKFSAHTVFLALHHIKKMETSFAGDGILGASAICGRTDAKIYLAQLAPEDERRIIFTSKRIGTAIPKTFLVFDPHTGKSELGETIAQAAHSRKQNERRAIISKTIEVLSEHPDMEHQELLSRLEGKFEHRLNWVRELQSNGLITRCGRGVRGSPFTYRVSEVPMEEVTAIQ